MKAICINHDSRLRIIMALFFSTRFMLWVCPKCANELKISQDDKP